MSFTQFFAAYWWLMFPVFGMFMALISMFQSERRTAKTMDLIKSYVDQGKEPPPELLKLAARQSDDWDMDMNMSGVGSNSRSGRAWSFVVFLALAAGFGAGYYFVREQDWSFAFVIVAVTMGVMALGSLLLLIFGRKS